MWRGESRSPASMQDGCINPCTSLLFWQPHGASSSLHNRVLCFRNRGWFFHNCSLSNMFCPFRAGLNNKLSHKSGLWFILHEWFFHTVFQKEQSLFPERDKTDAGYKILPKVAFDWSQSQNADWPYPLKNKQGQDQKAKCNQMYTNWI